MSRLDNRAYYDDFAGWYERERHLPYHRMLDDLEVEIVERYGAGKDQIMATLKQLGELKAAGVLTDAEFEAKKKELLAKL